MSISEEELAKQAEQLEEALKEARAQVESLKKEKQNQTEKIRNLKEVVRSNEKTIKDIKKMVKSIRASCKRVQKSNSKLKKQNNEDQSGDGRIDASKYNEMRQTLEKFKFEQAKVNDKEDKLVLEAMTRYKRKIKQLKANFETLEERKDDNDESTENTGKQVRHNNEMRKLFVDIPMSPSLQLVIRKQTPEEND
ncbi:hypothetical protein GPJ56_009352 [Histomonas meleagridis]|uniref:uncharacterized protein n=1 Tax=Histomonas meleagridis TaxID=135588 RepID=UPI00355A86FC|nr:hypothetical protein GPJ56_009352 [Histomonas meleagridis]KAH0797304.1 hypothetical protein GO595_009986 [Histomonas meleagridis]